MDKKFNKINLIKDYSIVYIIIIEIKLKKTLSQVNIEEYIFLIINLFSHAKCFSSLANRTSQKVLLDENTPR